MARFYSIAITPLAKPSNPSPQPNPRWTSLPNGVNDPGALNVEFDFPATAQGDPNQNQGPGTLTVHGISLAELQSAQNFAYSSIAVSGGMSKGLPLAVPQQAGLLMHGLIVQSYANWIGTEMNLNFVISPNGNTLMIPANFNFVWQPNEALATAIQTCLQVVYQNFTILPQIGSNYATPSTITHNVPTMKMFCSFIYSLTKGQVQIALQNNNTIIVFDGSVKPSAIKQLAFTDFIGQPKWVDNATMQFMTVMRGDIQVGSTVAMPSVPAAPGFVTTTPASNPSQFKYKTAFQGNFQIIAGRHVGNLRDPDGASWASIFEAHPLTLPAVGVPVGV